MANPSQSQDVEHTGPKLNPLGSQQRQSRAKTGGQDELNREAKPGPEQQEGELVKRSQHGPGVSAREVARGR